MSGLEQIRDRAYRLARGLLRRRVRPLSRAKLRSSEAFVHLATGEIRPDEYPTALFDEYHRLGQRNSRRGALRAAIAERARCRWIRARLYLRLSARGLIGRIT
jgi:hypothetical protein